MPNGGMELLCAGPNPEPGTHTQDKQQSFETEIGAAVAD